MSKLFLRAAIAAAAFACLFASPCALAQEAPNSPAATQPAAGHATVRQQLRYIRYGDDPTAADRRAEDIVWWHAVSVGLTGELSLSFEAPLIYREVDAPAPEDDGSHFGLGDMSLLLKWRFHQVDFGPIDTLRFALLAGAELPSGDDEYSSDSIDPEIGVILTYIRGRHGVNASALYKFTTGDHDHPISAGESLADLLRVNGSYLYRLEPERYEAATEGSLYAVVEALAQIETNGDAQLFIAPGLLYEARTWAAELSVALPAWQNVDHRPEVDFMLMLGIRLLF